MITGYCPLPSTEADYHGRAVSQRASTETLGPLADFHTSLFLSCRCCSSGHQRHMNADAQHHSIQPIHGSRLWTCKTCTLGLSCTRPRNNQGGKKTTKKRPARWQWQCTFPLLWLRLPEPSMQSCPCQRRRYVTAATAPAVHITNAVHGGGDHVLQPGSSQAPAAIAGAQLLQWPALSVCWESRSRVPLTLLSSHVQRSSLHFLNTRMLFFSDLEKFSCQGLKNK